MGNLHIPAVIRVLVLLTFANGAPVIAARLLGNWCEWRLDAGLNFIDGKPLLGLSKTVRGLIAAILATSCGGGLLGVRLQTTATFGLLAMVGDSFASFLKRRLNLLPSSAVPGLDQIPEAILPVLLLRDDLGLSGMEVAITVGIFWAGERPLSWILYRFGIRQHPH